MEAILNIGKPLLEDMIQPFAPAGFQFLSNAIDLQLPGCRDLLAGERLRFRDRCFQFRGGLILIHAWKRHSNARCRHLHARYDWPMRVPFAIGHPQA